MLKLYVTIWIIETSHSLFESHLAAQIGIVYYVEYFVNSCEMYLTEHFVQKSCDATYYSLLNSHGYFSANTTNVSEQLSLKPPSRAHFVNE